MTGIWVDTDFGFDDLWALLLLRHLGCRVAGVSRVAGNAALAQVAANAMAAKHAYGFDWPLWQGAAGPLVRTPETATRILGPTGMRSRGAQLVPAGDPPPDGALAAMARWVAAEGPHELLALGPLTNIARLVQAVPDLAARLDRLVWMGGSAGPGNHTPHAEFNAVADAEELEIVRGAGIPFDIVDLTFCRTITFGEADMPAADPLTRDLLGGYLDIALERGRSGMAIYDPLAALALALPGCIAFAPCTLKVETGPGPTYGATTITPVAASPIRVAVRAEDTVSGLCLGALEKETAHVARH